MLPQHNTLQTDVNVVSCQSVQPRLLICITSGMFGSSMMHALPPVDVVCTRLVHRLLLSSPQARLQVADAAVAAGTR